MRKSDSLFLGRCEQLRHAAFVILHVPLVDKSALPSFVEDCLRRRVQLIAAVGVGARRIEGEIDRIIVGDGFRKDRFAITTAHPSKRDALRLISSMRAADEREIKRAVHWCEVRL